MKIELNDKEAAVLMIRIVKGSDWLFSVAEINLLDELYQRISEARGRWIRE